MAAAKPKMEAAPVKNEKGAFTGRKKLLWDPKNMKITNFDDAHRFVKRECKNGYTLDL